ncbi:hypothetical protein RFI_02280 [Reticulomyxa filosa]|uniref:Uncharacterized protein n=1 Tax=Reticulomyxa filosa TaxID=46433 RepID=X6PAZ1_RETFI|nr:hypothetical protein RFI_02280 [Reticulomyxa filosa]|eukprot:ETO34807.1 hypothetical protein RFI_02280 [Reticulomyxa filosa]
MFRKILIRVSDEKLAEYEQFLKEVPLLDSLLSNERRAVAEALDEAKYQKGDVVVQQGDIGDTFYIIRKGTAAVLKATPSTLVSGKPVMKEIKRLTRGDFFGERALIKNDVRAATVQVIDEEMTCLSLDREAFALLLGPLAELMKRKIDEEYDHIIHRRKRLVAGDNNNTNNNNNSYDRELQFEESEQKSNNFYNEKENGHIGNRNGNGKHNNGIDKHNMSFRTHIPKLELITIGILGKGSFGSVELVKHKKTGKTYALKQVSKQQIVETGQKEHIINEKHVQMLLDSPFIVKLYQTYKDKKYLYFYWNAFDYMHSKDIIYRDLKPENLLLNDKGYLKIADFGFAKIIKDWDRTYTLCGLCNLSTFQKTK